MLLPVCQFASSRVIHPEQSHNGVDNQELEDPRLLVEHGSGKVQQFKLLFGGMGPGIEDVVQNGFLVQIISLGDGPEAVGPEGIFGVKEQDFSPGVSVCPGHLGGDAQGVAELGLARPEFPKSLGN